MYTFGCGLNGQLGIGETRKYLLVLHFGHKHNNDESLQESVD